MRGFPPEVFDDRARCPPPRGASRRSPARLRPHGPPARLRRPRHPWRGVIAEYRDRLPVDEATPVGPLREGGTPLLPAPVLSARTGGHGHLKVEGANPTGSFKDRGMTVAISAAAGRGAQAVICASTGNTSASAAAYAARAGMTCAVLVPRGKIAIGSWPRPSCTGPSCSRSAAASTTAWRSRASCPPSIPSPWSTRSTGTGSKGQDRRVRDRGRSRRRARRAPPPARQRRQHYRVLEGL